MGDKSSDPNKAAMKQQKRQMKRLDRLSLPELEEYILQNPELVGLLDAETIADTELENIQLDPRLRENQMRVLEDLQKRSDEGLTDQDKYQMEQMLGDVAAQERSQRAATEAEMARRGMDSSGAALMAKMQDQQSGANQARERAMQMAAQAQQNRMAALAQLGQQSGQMESQDFDRQSQIASAKDAIARANAMNRQNVSGQNLAARQAIENQRANIANQQSQVANQIAQQNFQNQISKVTGQGNVANAMSNIAGNAPQRPGALQAGLAGASTGAGVGGQIGGAAGAGYGAAIGGGLGAVSSMFADGGIARSEGGVPVSQEALEAEKKRKYREDEEKQHEKFKKNYMKRIHDEILNSKREVTGDPQHAEDGNVMYAQDGGKRDMRAFNSAFKQARAIHGGDGGEFTFEGKRYSTDLAKPKAEDQKPSLEEMRSYQGEHDKMLKEDEKTAEGLSKGLGALSKIMSDSQPKRSKLELGQFSMQQPENVMNPVGPQQFANPFRAEDGAIINDLVSNEEFPERGGTDFASPNDRKSAMIAALMTELDMMNPENLNIPMDRPIPEYKDGGTAYMSDGSGDIVDSGMESYAGDRVDAKINDGEAVLNVPQQQRFMDLVRGKISVDELGDDDIIEGVPRDYRDHLHEKIEKESDGEGSKKIEGLSKLLDILGEE